MNEKKLSRQRLWQINRKSQGRCTNCGKRSPNKMLCDACSEKAGVVKRNPTKAEWDAVDYSLPSKEIAKMLKVRVACVCEQAKKRGKSKPRGRPKKQLP